MIIKKFQGKTEESAIADAKKELGNNVVIMNVKKVKPKGLFSLLKKQIFEVTVALEDEKDKYNQIQSSIVKTDIGKETQEQKIEPSNSKTDIQDKNEKNLETKIDSLQTLLEKQLIRREENNTEEYRLEENKTQDDTKQQDNDETFIFTQLLYNTLIDNEVNEKFANQIIEEFGKSHKPNMPIDYILSNIYQKMILKFGKPEGIQAAEKGPKVIFFVGPTGVGKTTTIAKIASKFKVEKNNKIALLTADTYRIAAAEQLRTYAGILDVPFRVIYSPEEARNAIHDFSSYEFIFVDTTGHSHHNETQKETMQEFLECLGDDIEKEVYLVLSATTKYRDLVNIADAYHKLSEYKLIFTKLDETETLGNLLNLKLHTGASLSYVTSGQNLPEDIETFNPQNTVKLLLGGKR